MRAHRSWNSFPFDGAPGTTRRDRRGRRHRLAHVHGSKHTIKFSRNRFQWERFIRKLGHHALNSVFRETSQVQCLPASNIWEGSNSVDTNKVQFAQLFFVSHEPHGDWFAFRSCHRVVSEKGVEKLILAGRKFFHQGDSCNTFMTLSRPVMFRRSSGVSMVTHVIRAGPDNPETSLAAKLYFTFQFSPSRHTRISSRNDSHLAAFPFQVRTCLRSAEAAPLRPYSFSSGVQASMPPSLRRRPKSSKFLSAVRVRLAEIKMKHVVLNRRIV